MMSVKIVVLLGVSVFLWTQWKQMHVALRDLDFIYTTVLEHHPGPYNNEDPSFLKKTTDSYKRFRQTLMVQVLTGKQQQIISEFAKSFEDVHVWVHWFNREDRQGSSSRKKTLFEAVFVDQGILWIKVPTFMLSESLQKDYRNFLTEVLQKLVKAEKVVFDLRGNAGGNSQYGADLIDTVFGQDCAESKRKMYQQRVVVDWRLTKDNVEHVEKLAKEHPVSWLQELARDMRNAFDKKLLVFTEKNEAFAGRVFNGSCKDLPVFVIIDSGNVSAALDFIDEVKLVSDQVTLIGQETKGDSLYMDVRAVRLPSGLGEFWFPIKVYKNRVRKNKETYKPDIVQDVQNDQKLLQIIKIAH